MEYPIMPEAARLALLEPPASKVRFVLDTDTYNEIDDQFALAYALLSPEKLETEAIYAAPFHNNRSSGPGDGMEKSYEEILRVLDRMGVEADGLAHRGSTGYLGGRDEPEQSDAARDLIERAMRGGGEPLYVAAIGAITNVASAILIEPRIIERIVVIWLGGQPQHWSGVQGEFNLRQDIRAGQVVFDSGVPLVRMPCHGVTSHLTTTLAEMERYVRGRGPVGDYLYEIFRDYCSHDVATSKVIWDIAAIAWLIDPDWVPTELVHSPLLTDQGTWSVDRGRHLIREATFIHRDPVFRDLFTRLDASGKGE